MFDQNALFIVDISSVTSDLRVQCTRARLEVKILLLHENIKSIGWDSCASQSTKFSFPSKSWNILDVSLSDTCKQC